MQDNFSEWPIYIPFIACNENLLFLRENNLSLCLRDMTDKMAAFIESYSEMYKRPYLLNRSIYLQKINWRQNVCLFNLVLLKWQLKFVGPSLKQFQQTFWNMFFFLFCFVFSFFVVVVVVFSPRK